MAKFDVTIWYTVSFTRNVEIEAEDEEAANIAAQHIFETADPVKQWGYDAGELDFDIEELEDGQ
jgi:hypothetical protein